MKPEEILTIRVNGEVIMSQAKTVFQLHREIGHKANLLIYNGFAITDDCNLADGDEIYLIDTAKMPNSEQLHHMMMARHTPKVHLAMTKGCVGIAGCGGLGSHVALALARMGVGHLVLVDFDKVEPSNLNRQAYGVSHLGQIKVNALRSILAEINPYIEVVAKDMRIDSTNALSVFEPCSIVIEAFDLAENKAMLVETLMTNTEKVVIAASGLAGMGSCNDLVTKKIGHRLFLVGDGISGAQPGMGLMAPRVMAAAAHQANMAVQVLLGNMDV